MSILILCLALAFITFLSGFFSASETALFSLPSTKIKYYQKNTDPRKRLIANLVLQPRDLLVTVFMLNTLVNILLQNIVSSLFGDAASWLLKVCIPFILLLIFGEIVPKYIGIQNNEKLSYIVAPSISWLQNFLRPIKDIIIQITAPVTRLLFFFLRKEEEISRDELKHVLHTSQEQGVLHKDEADLVWGYLSLHELCVKEIMRPREDILFYEISEPLTKLVHLFVDQECSRVPVCEKTIENTVGIVNAQNYFLHRYDILEGKEILKIVQKPFFIPESTPAHILLQRFDEQNEIMALVVDEYGSISGLVSHEDLVEVVVGEISDLRDPKSLYTRSTENEIVASGRLEITDFNDIFQSEIKSEMNMVTISGWVVEKLGEIPKTGDKFTLDHFVFQVLAADAKKILKLYIRKIAKK